MLATVNTNHRRPLDRPRRRRREAPAAASATMAASASPDGMIPEQARDAAPIPQRRLHRGRPTRSAMPLAQAHAAFIKLGVPRDHGRPIDRPEAVWKRYRGVKKLSAYTFLRGPMPGSVDGCGLPSRPCAASGRKRALGSRRMARSQQFRNPRYSLGFWAAEVDSIHLKEGQSIDFTIRWQEDDWTGVDYRIEITGSGQACNWFRDC